MMFVALKLKSEEYAGAKEIDLNLEYVVSIEDAPEGKKFNKDIPDGAIVRDTLGKVYHVWETRQEIWDRARLG